jgi:hypothetical protein
VNLVLGTLELTTIGGVGTYLVTVGEQLERMGHGVTVLAAETGSPVPSSVRSPVVAQLLHPGVRGRA